MELRFYHLPSDGYYCQLYILTKLSIDMYHRMVHLKQYIIININTSDNAHGAITSFEHNLRLTEELAQSCCNSMNHNKAELLRRSYFILTVVNQCHIDFGH